jgi:hypothetical protein
MSKKIRIYEKQRRGIDAFIGPRGNYTVKNNLGKGNREMVSHNQQKFGNIIGGGYSKTFNFY